MRSSFVCLFLLLFSSAASAQLFVLDEGLLGHSGMILRMNGQDDDWRVLPASNSGNEMSVRVDPANFSMVYERVTINSAPATVSFTKNIVTQFGSPARPITAEVDFNPVEVDLFNLGPLQLQQNPDGNFYATRITGLFQFVVGGSYRIIDGENILDGMFSETIHGRWEAAGSVDVGQYPDAITIGASGVSPWRYFEFSRKKLFSERIDDMDIEIELYRYSIRPPNYVTLQAIPEARATAFLIGALALVLVGFQRRFRRRR